MTVPSATAVTVVEAAEPPAEVRSLANLRRVDYTDAFSVTAVGTSGWSGERWARFVLEEAAGATRCRLIDAWLALGLRIDPARHDRVLGWRARSGSDEHLVMSASSWTGMRGEIAFARVGGHWWLATFVELGNRRSRSLWSAVESGHRETVTFLLRDAATRAGRLPVPADGPPGPSA
jgi:hypothetical protein